MSVMVRGLKRVAVRIPPDETCSHCGQAVRGCEDRKFGFLLSNGTDFVKVRFLGPRGFSDVEVRKSHILGMVGETFFSSVPAQPEVCERVVFFDRGRQRKGWVWNVEPDGKVTLLLDVQFRYPVGKSPEVVEAKSEAERRARRHRQYDVANAINEEIRAARNLSPNEIETSYVFEERWVEELVILPPGEGFHRLSDKEVQELDSFGYEDKNSSSAFKREKRRETKGGSGETTELLERAERGAEELRALLAELESS